MLLLADLQVVGLFHNHNNVKFACGVLFNYDNLFKLVNMHVRHTREYIKKNSFIKEQL